MQAFPAHRESVRGVCMAPSDLKFATASDDSTVKACRPRLDSHAPCWCASMSLREPFLLNSIPHLRHHLPQDERSLP